MITGNTVKELNSDNIPGQPNKQPENGPQYPNYRTTYRRYGNTQTVTTTKARNGQPSNSTRTSGGTTARRHTIKVSPLPEYQSTVEGGV